VRLETKQALDQAMAEGDEDKIAVIAAYYAHDWDSLWPWPGPGWMQGRYETWENYKAWLLRYAREVRQLL